MKMWIIMGASSETVASNSGAMILSPFNFFKTFDLTLGFFHIWNICAYSSGDKYHSFKIDLN